MNLLVYQHSIKTVAALMAVLTGCVKKIYKHSTRTINFIKPDSFKLGDKYEQQSPPCFGFIFYFDFNFFATSFSSIFDIVVRWPGDGTCYTEHHC